MAYAKVWCLSFCLLSVCTTLFICLQEIEFSCNFLQLVTSSAYQAIETRKSESMIQQKMFMLKFNRTEIHTFFKFNGRVQVCVKAFTFGELVIET